jgi:hypothetical protein
MFENLNTFDQGANFLKQLHSNPLFLSGIAQANPGAQNPLIQAAAFQRQQEEAQRQQDAFEMERQQALSDQEQSEGQRMMQESLPELLSQLDPNDIKGSWRQLLQAGVKPEAASVIIKQLNEARGMLGAENPQALVKPQAVQPVSKAQNKILAKEGINQFGTPVRKLTAAEIRLNKANLDKLNVTSKASAEQLKQLDALDKAYATFDKETGGKSGAGSYLSSLLPESGENEGFTKRLKVGIENTFYSDKARNALHTIKKVNSLLLQKRIEEKKGTGQVTDVLKKEIKEGLPRPDILPEARKENIKSLKQEALKNILEQQFYSTWSQFNQRDTDQAGAAFQQFLSTVPLIKPDGSLNKELLQQIPTIVQEYLSEPNKAQEQQGFENFNYNFE